MKKIARLFIIPTLFCLASCNLLPNKNGSSSGGTSSGSSSTSTDSGSGDPSTSSDYIFHTSGSYLPFDNYGVHISDEASGYKNRDILQGGINTEAGFTLVSAISADGCNIQTDNGETQKEHFHLSVGSGSAGGYIEFTFSKTFTRVAVSCIAYYKTYSGGQSVDTDSTIIIDGDSHPIPNNPEATSQEAQTFEKTYSSAANKLKLSNITGKQRFYIESVQIFA